MPPPPPTPPPFLPLPVLTECEGTVMSVKLWQDNAGGHFHHLKMVIWIRHWKPWGRLVLSWRGHAQLWRVEGGRNLFLDHWMYNEKSRAPFELDRGYPTAIVLELDEVPHYSRSCGTPQAEFHETTPSGAHEWACLIMEGSLDTDKSLGSLQVLQSPESGPLHPEVALRCISGEPLSISLRESSWIQHTQEKALVGKSAGDSEDVKAIEKACVLDFRPLDGIELTHAMANSATPDDTDISLTLRHWWPGALVTLSWPEVPVDFELVALPASTPSRRPDRHMWDEALGVISRPQAIYPPSPPPPTLVWGAELLEMKKTKAATADNGGKLWRFPARYGKWANEAGLYGARQESDRKGGMTLMFRLGPYDSSDRFEHPASRSSPDIPLGEGGRRCIDPFRVPPPSPSNPPPSEPPLLSSVTLLQKASTNIRNRSHTIKDTLLSDFDRIARDLTYSSSSCSFGFRARSLPKQLPRVTCHAQLPPSPPPPPPTPFPPPPSPKPPPPWAPPLEVFRITTQTSCSQTLGKVIVTLASSNWDEVNAELGALNPGDDDSRMDKYTFTARMLFEKWVEGILIHTRLRGEGIRVQQVQQAKILKGAPTSGSADDDVVDGVLDLELQLLEPPRLFQQANEILLFFDGVLDEWMAVECVAAPPASTPSIASTTNLITHPSPLPSRAPPTEAASLSLLRQQSEPLSPVPTFRLNAVPDDHRDAELHDQTATNWTFAVGALVFLVVGVTAYLKPGRTKELISYCDNVATKGRWRRGAEAVPTAEDDMDFDKHASPEDENLATQQSACTMEQGGDAGICSDRGKLYMSKSSLPSAFEDEEPNMDPVSTHHKHKHARVFRELD